LADITAERVRQLLHYDAETGQLVWRHSGKVAGCPAGRAGRLQVHIDGKARYAHRLIWLWVHGEWPAGQIDHINGDKHDNRIENLRVLSGTAENKQNQSRAYRNNRYGVLGVSRASNGRWRARIMVDGKSVSLGTFETCDEAADEYRAAKRRLHPHWVESA
jgi:hypothetical protein